MAPNRLQPHAMPTTPDLLTFAQVADRLGVGVLHRPPMGVADDGNDRVVALASGSTTQVVLPFTGLERPFGVAVDTAGTVYVTDFDNNRVVIAGGRRPGLRPWPNL